VQVTNKEFSVQIFLECREGKKEWERGRSEGGEEEGMLIT